MKPLAEKSFDMQLQELLKQKKYRQALEEIKKIQRSQPDIEFTPKESEIWLLRGQQEFEKQDYKQAQKSFKHALELGLVGEVYYWLSRCLLELNQLDAAVDLLRDAFEKGSLIKDYSICYLKVLLLKGDTATVEQLINTQAKQFSTAQLHWIKGVLSIKNGQSEAALTSFQKIKNSITPGDYPFAWIVYTQQTIGNWDAAANLLGLKSSSGQFGLSYSKPKYLEHPILERLATFQKAKTGQPPVELKQEDKVSQEATKALQVVQLIDEDNYHEAAHVLLKIDRRSTNFKELESLRPSLLTLAGQQALTEEETECVELFWQPLLTEQPFNPQLAVNLIEVLELNDSYQERQRLLTRLLKWLEQEGKQKPQEWPKERLNLVLAHIHCLLADNYIAMDRDRPALASVQQAERICPTSPEVIGRKGLIAASQDNYTQAIPLLTQALENGCRYEEVYGILLGCCKKVGDEQAFNETRRRFGKDFGDIQINIDKATEVSPWVQALSTLSYPFFSRLIQGKDSKDPALNACEIFVNAVQSPPNSGGRVSLNQPAATKEWETLLQKLSGDEQIPVLQAIALPIILFAKREKGIAALTNKYIQKLLELSSQYPEAKIAHLVVLAVKENSPQKLDVPLQAYLNNMPQPGNALANIQFQVRRFGNIATLAPSLDEALRREPQNPLLLLARATTYPVQDPNYEKLKQQGFELARRLQDAKALQAFREEQAFLSEKETLRIMPDPERFDDLDSSDLDDLLDEMLRKLLGSKVPKAEFERMLPELKEMMLNNMPGLEDDDDDEYYEDDDDELDLDSIFGFGKFKPTSKKQKGRKRGGFQELF
jgi:tetratricopeptide (TPR) repeat protein